MDLAVTRRKTYGDEASRESYSHPTLDMILKLSRALKTSASRLVLLKGKVKEGSNRGALWATLFEETADSPT